jgi:anti-anti-sigma regulatory factor
VEATQYRGYFAAALGGNIAKLLSLSKKSNLGSPSAAGNVVAVQSEEKGNLTMIRISEHGSSDGNRVVRLEGRVVGRSVAEVQTFCQEILSQGLALTIDMAEVSFLDKSAVGLFKKLKGQQVRLLNCSPFLSELLKSAPL